MSMHLHQPILVVAGPLPQREELYDSLTRHGFSVLAARTGEGALEALKRAWPGLIVVDSRLLDMPEPELVRRIRGVHPDVPILVLCTPHERAEAPDARVQHVTVNGALLEPLLLPEVERWLAAAPPPAEAAPARGHILLVDDELKQRGIVQEFLQLQGFSVTLAGSGEEALEFLAQALPRVVLLDLRLPGMDGLLTLKKIRMLYPTLPVIVVTQVYEDQALEEATVLGADDYITKPFNFQHLKDVLLRKVFK